MIEGKLAMTGRITGFRAGDKQIQLNWDVEDGEGDFRREDILDTGYELNIPEEATMIIFIPGPQPALTKEETAITNAQDALDKAKEKKDTDGVTQAKEALGVAKKALEDAKVRISISSQDPAGTAVPISISGTAPTILTSDAGKAGKFKFTAATTKPNEDGSLAAVPCKLENCEFIVL